MLPPMSSFRSAGARRRSENSSNGCMRFGSPGGFAHARRQHAQQGDARTAVSVVFDCGFGARTAVVLLARNRGSQSRRATWLLFLDADVEAVPDLIDRYLEPAPAARTAVLCGSIRDAPAKSAGSESLASRYSRLRRLIDQSNTLQMERPYAKTANCAIRRVAFEQVGGFVGDIRSGGDLIFASACTRRGGRPSFVPMPSSSIAAAVGSSAC